MESLVDLEIRNFISMLVFFGLIIAMLCFPFLFGGGKLKLR